MSRERWSKIEELFHSALQRDPSARMAFLAEACGGDVSLREEVDALLAADGEAGSFLERLHELEPMMLEPGYRLGAYQIVGLIGRGGMGEVYRARDTRLAREVAIKVLPALRLEGATSLDDGRARNAARLHRFEIEALLTAGVQHPAVVPIYERGKLPDGRPFYAMKLVSGRSLRELIDERKTLAERMALLPNLIAVADALAHAHSRRILHRDVKPSNIIIGEFAETLLIDWGVAKNLASRAGESQLPGALDTPDRTALGAIIGTPAYMSPEQAKGLPVDERADVFALGATLYHLLAGRAPYEGDTRSILPMVAQGHYAPLSERQTEVPGELAAIVDKAMAPEIAQRYPTARELAEDLRRFQTGQLVLSHRYSARELVLRWARRHRALLVTSGIFFALAAAGAVMGVRRIAAERDRASREAEASLRVSQFMTEMFKVSDPSEARGNSVTAREILEKASLQIEGGLTRDPGVQARLMETMAQVYESLGLYAKARPLAEKAVELRQTVLGPEHLDTLRSMSVLGNVERKQGQFAEAEKIHRQVFDLRRRVLGPEHPETLSSMSDLGSVKQGQGQYAAAQKLHQDVLEVRRRTLGPEHADTLMSMHNLAGVELVQRHYGPAEKLYREVVDIRRRVLGSEHPDTLRSMHNVADVLYTQGQYAAAGKLHREVLEIRRRVLGPEHPDTLKSMHALAVLEWQQKRYPAAQELEQEVVEIQRRVLGAEHPDTLRSMQNLAVDETALGRYADADKLCREILEARRRVLGPEHPDTLSTMVSLAIVQTRLGRYDEAERLYLQTLDIRRRLLGPEYALVGRSLYGLAIVALLQGDRKKALDYLRQAVDDGLNLRHALTYSGEELKPLRGDPEFEALVARGKAPAPDR